MLTTEKKVERGEKCSLILWRITEFTLLIIVGSLSLVTWVVMKPVIRGFFCQDLTIRLPYHDSTVPSILNYIISLMVPISILIYQQKEKFIRGALGNLLYLFLNVELVSFVFGAVSTQLLTNIMKMESGRLRPHFLDVCRPDVDFSPASSACGTLENPIYITNYSCIGNPHLFPQPETLEHRLREARLSFPSGHTSLAVYGMMGAILYLQLDRGPRTVAVQFLQMLCAMYALFVGVSRVTDNKHHPGDVVAGGLLGAAVALAVVLRLLGVRTRREGKKRGKISLMEVIGERVSNLELVGAGENRRLDTQESEEQLL